MIMTLSDVLLQSVMSFRPNYEEGMSVTAEVAQNARKSYQGFHETFLANATMRRVSCFFELDCALERFYKRTKEQVDSQRYDSLVIIGDYLELNDCFEAVKKYLASHYK